MKRSRGGEGSWDLSHVYLSCMLGPAGSGLGCVWYMTFWIENDDERRTTMMRAVLIETTIRDTIHPFPSKSPPLITLTLSLTQSFKSWISQSKVKEIQTTPSPFLFPFLLTSPPSPTSPHFLQPRQGKPSQAKARQR